MLLTRAYRIPSFAALVVAVGLSACQTQSISPTWPMPEGALTRTVNGYPMAYSEKGTGPTLVLVHGVLVDYRYWQTQVNALSPSFHVIAVSLRHFYPEKWSGKGDDFTVEQHAHDLTAFIESLGRPVHLLGWSYGGAVAYQAARERPDLVRKLVLVEAGIDGLIGTADAASTTLVADRAKVTAALFDKGDLEGGLNYAVDSINGAGFWAKVPEPAKQVVRDNAWTVVGIGKTPPPQVTCAAFGQLKMPVLLVQGELTTPRYKRIVGEQAGCLPTASRATIPNAGHPSASGNPKYFTETVAAFLR